jgi:biotin transport system substrate-specific component
MSADARTQSFVDASISHSSLAPVIRAGSVALAVAVTAAAAQVSIPLPFTPVPLVFTPLAVLVSAAALGGRLGMIAQLAYLAAGLSGLPVFAPSASLPPGPLRLLGPTGGYLMAYPVAAFVTGSLAERGWDRRYWSSFAAMLLGLAVIFAGGVSWLAVTVTHGLQSALTAGLRWFVLLDVLKLAAGAMVLPYAWTLAGRSPRDPA